MIWNHCIAILLILSVLLTGVSCNTSTDSSKKGTDKTGQADELSPSALEAMFKEAPSGLLDSVDILCANSKSYRADQWNELNHCRWALEKQVLEKIPEYAKRKDDLLSLQMDNGHWMALEHVYGEGANSQFYQLRKYLPQPHFFIISQHISSGCTKQWFVDAKSGQKMFFSGDIWKDPASDTYVTIPRKSKNCEADIHVIHFNKAGDIKYKIVKFPDDLKSIKWVDGATILQLEDSTGNMKYHKAELL